MDCFFNCSTFIIQTNVFLDQLFRSLLAMRPPYLLLINVYHGYMITYRVYENQCILMSYFSGDVVTFFCFVCYFAFSSRITNDQFWFIFHSHNIMMFGEIFFCVFFLYIISTASRPFAKEACIDRS